MLHEEAFFVLTETDFQMVRLDRVWVCHFCGWAENMKRLDRIKNKNPEMNLMGLLPCLMINIFLK